MRSTSSTDARSRADARSARRHPAAALPGETVVQPLTAVGRADDFERLALAETGHCVALFGARWCAPAYRLAERLADIADRQPMTALWIDIDELPTLARRYQVTALPALALLRNGQVIAQRIGDLDTDALESWIEGAGPI